MDKHALFHGVVIVLLTALGGVAEAILKRHEKDPYTRRALLIVIGMLLDAGIDSAIKRITGG
jgi:hypothetical protein